VSHWQSRYSDTPKFISHAGHTVEITGFPLESIAVNLLPQEEMVGPSRG
jgi:hypothetical protein